MVFRPVRSAPRPHAAGIGLAMVCLAAVFLSAPAAGQGAARWPAKPIRLLVPYAAGGGADAVARPVVQKLTEALGTQFLYDNRGSSGGILAVEAAARAAPDGHTLLLGSGSTQSINPNLYTNLPYQSPRDFAPVTVLANAPLVLTVSAKFPAKNLQELLAWGKANPGRINFGSAGSSVGLMSIELLQMRGGIRVQHVPYKGSGPAFMALLAGEIDMFLVNIGVIAGALKDGRVRAIANGGLQRLQAIPDVATFDELGLKGYEAGSWYGLLAPAGTPRPVIERLHQETVRVLRQPEIEKLFAAQGAYAVGNTPAEMAELIGREIAMWAQVAKTAGIKPETL